MKPTRLLLALLLLSGCGALQNDVNVVLPTYDNQLVVECYLESGRVPRLTVTESVHYLANGQAVSGGSQAFVLPNGQPIQLPTDVTVTLTLPGGRALPLVFQPGIVLENGSTVPLSQLDRLNRDSVAFKIFTHTAQAQDVLTLQPGQTFTLEARDQRGRRVTGATSVPARVPLDSVALRYNTLPPPDRKALQLAYWQDVPGTDFYRRMIQRQRRGILRQASNDNDVEDRILNGTRQFVVGTSYRFDPGDTLQVTLFHLDSAFYSFRTSTREARQANGNPFGQPSSIRSTVKGGIGVFTALSYDRKRIIVK